MLDAFLGELVPLKYDVGVPKVALRKVDPQSMLDQLLKDLLEMPEVISMCLRVDQQIINVGHHVGESVCDCFYESLQAGWGSDEPL
jgi:hypothetical protein